MGQEPVSGFNQQKIPPADSSGFSFLVGGHLYGSGYNQNSVFPSPALYANLDEINQSGAGFLIACGDLMRDSRNPLHRKNFKSYTQKLQIPFFNAPGNHDLLNRPAYAEEFGPSRQFFLHEENFFLVLDAEAMIYPVDSINLSTFLTRALDTLQAHQGVKNVFVFSHRLLWALERPDLQFADQHCNHPWSHEAHIPFLDELMPAIYGLTDEKKVFWFSGDVGTPWSYPLLYQPDPQYPNLTYIATGMGNGVWDALVKVEVFKDGEVKMIPMPLCGQEMMEIEAYDRANLEKQFAEKGPEPPISFANRVWLLLRARTFWVGAMAGIFLMILGVGLAWLLRRRKGGTA